MNQDLRTSKFAFLKRVPKMQRFLLAGIGALLLVEGALTMFGNGPLFLPSLEKDSPAVIGSVVQTETDVRQKPDDNDDWFRAENGGDVVKGDAIYSGEKSRALVRLTSGAEVALEEDVLVIFLDTDNILLPDASRGNVKLRLDGSMKLSFSGQETEFTGVNSEILVSLDPSNGKGSTFKFLKGETKVKENGGESTTFALGQTLDIARAKSVTAIDANWKAMIAAAKKVAKLSTSKLSDLRRKTAVPTSEGTPENADTRSPLTETPPVTPTIPEPVVVATPEPAPLVVATPEPTPEPTPIAVVEPAPVAPPEVPPKTDAKRRYFHAYRIGERYRRINERELQPKAHSNQVRARIDLGWNGAIASREAFVQVSRSTDFSSPWLEAVSSDSAMKHSAWPVGENYWRVSYDKKTWSKPVRLEVQAGWARDRQPTIATPGKNIVISTPKPGSRGKKKPRAVAKLNFKDAKLTQAAAWVLQATQSETFEQEQTKSVLVRSASVEIPLRRPGKYYFRVQSMNAEGELSGFSKPVAVNVSGASDAVQIRLARLKRAEAVAQARRIAAIEEEERVAEEKRLEEEAANEAKRIAREEREAEILRKREARETAMRLEKERIEKMMTKLLNRERHWNVGLEGGMFATANQPSNSPNAHPEAFRNATSAPLVGVKAGFDDGTTGVRLNYRKEEPGRTSTSGDDVSATRFDARYESWYRFEENLFNRPMRYGFFAGYAHYRVPRTPQITQPFDLAKAGLSLEIEIWENWKGGGDFIYGRWIDSSQSFEVNGFMGYEFSRTFDFGLGYRLSIFDSGTETDGGVGFPYRGLTGEAYSGLRYSF